jgi:hypothetical protein
MTITPELVFGDDVFNELANRLARELSSAFGYTLAEAEKHIADFYAEFEASIPERSLALREMGSDGELHAWTALELFFHEDSALVLMIGYRLAGGDIDRLEFLSWRRICWEPLRNGQRVPSPNLSVVAD